MIPITYTLPGVMAVNGSDANGGCPSPCVGMVVDITVCDCLWHSTGAGAITGALIDGVVPTIDTTVDLWAAPLFTVRGSADTVILGFRLPASVVLQEVELYLFNCPQWGIGAQSVRIHSGAAFPQFFRVFDSIGIVTLASDRQNCGSLTRVFIPLQMARNLPFYFIEFHNPSGAVIYWVYIAEVRFSGQPFSETITTITPTTAPTTGKNENRYNVNCSCH